MLSERVIAYERLVAPREHLGVLIEPRAEAIRAMLAPPYAAGAETRIGDSTIAALRDGLRAELGLRGPVIVGGHQPEFLHAGVFAKNIAASELARAAGGSVAFLTVDTDVPKSASLRLPQVMPGGLRRVDVPIPDVDPTLPYCDQPRAARDRWVQFFAQVGAMHAFLGDAPLGLFARAWVEEGGATPDYCDAFIRARVATERMLGLGPTVEVRETRLARTPAFRAFFGHVALHAAEFAAAYNAAQAAYRKRHRVRARGRPVPPLLASATRVELPFWIVPAGGARRRMFAQAQADHVTFFADDERAFDVPRAALERAAHGEVVPAPWRVWPRALTMSAFARLFLADLFIHGIGGAKYDEMTEELIRAFLNIEPAPMCCVTATLHLPLQHSAIASDDLRRARLASRDLRYNPQRHVRAAPTELVARRTDLIRTSTALREQHPRERAERRVVFREIRRVNEQILQTDAWRAAQYDERISVLERQLALDRIALDREYFYALHPMDTLTELKRRIAALIE